MESSPQSGVTKPVLPYGFDALEPHISKETLEYHYGKHHCGYFNKLMKQLEGHENADKDLVWLCKNTKGGMFNNAAQIWNHSFYWNCMGADKDARGGAPKGKIGDAITATFGSFDKFKDAFSKSALTNFGSGWTWLVQNQDGSLAITNTDDAFTPLTGDAKPVLAIDVWEHAYYIDYRNGRGNYIAAFWNLVNWGFVNGNMA